MSNKLSQNAANVKVVRGPLRFPGGKTRALQKIFALIPNFKEYREPMVGGASVFLTLKEKFPGRSYWINDFNHDLFAFWNACKEIPNALINEALKIKRSGKPGKILFQELRKPLYELTDFERGLRFYILNRISFSGLVDTGGYSKESFEGRFTEKSIKLIALAGKYLSGVRVTNLSYELLLMEPGEDVFIYLDPPYIGNIDSKLYGLNGVLHTTFDHSKLRAELRKCPYNWLLTYDDSPVIRSTYSFASIYEGEVSYGMNNVGKIREKRRDRELFICNYDLNQKTLKEYGLSQV